LGQDKFGLSSAWSPDHTPPSTPVSFTTKAIVPATPVRPKVRLSPWTAEVVKLASVGIEEGVMLSFIDNAGMFNLGADQIIYLSDLGVPGLVISEMLRHDAEVIAGVRPLTIASDPPADPSIHITFTRSSSASVKSTTQTVSTSVPPASVSGSSAVPRIQNPSPSRSVGVTNTGASLFELAMTDNGRPASFEPGQQRLSDGKRGIYRVREPYPVQLTAPIIFVRAPERNPNTIVIEWFPESTDER
jgi:hypothetical protein